MITQISNVNYQTNFRSLCQYPNKTYKNSVNNSFGKSDEEYKQKIEKMKYLDSHTYETRELAYLGLIGTFAFESLKNKPLAYGCLTVSVGAIISESIQKMKLSTEYNKNHNNI